LLKEAELIKKHQPKFNVLWRDDKNYFFVAVTKEDFPRIFITHQLKQKLEIRNSKLEINYVGPFVAGIALKKTLQFLRKIFPYRTCKTIPKRPCLWYQMRLCPGPCLLDSKVASQIPNFKEKIKKESQENTRVLLKIFQGRRKEVLKNLKKEMKKFSKAQEFEKAANRRDRIELLENIFEHARVLQGLTERKIENWQRIEKELRKILDQKLKIRTCLASLDRTLISARKKIYIPKIKRIEGYDISNIQGKEATGAMVVFEKGKPDKDEYRKFKIKIEGKPNDVAMLKEVLSRRFKHREWRFPQLILIDGGKAQLNIAKKVLNQYKSALSVSISVFALAKRKNTLYLENQKEPIFLKDIPQEISNLILRIRDEAHRFAISYHKKLREKKFIG